MASESPPLSHAPLILCQAMRARPAQMPADTARNLEAMLPDLRHVARRLCPSAQAADNLLQDTLLHVWSRVAEADGTAIADIRGFAFAALRERAEMRGNLSTEALRHAV